MDKLNFKDFFEKDKKLFTELNFSGLGRNTIYINEEAQETKAKFPPLFFPKPKKALKMLPKSRTKAKRASPKQP